MITDGPTLNPEYNALLVKWGTPDAAECEECGEDVHGKMVHDCGTHWLCDACRDEVQDDDSFDGEPRPFFDPDREDFHADG